MLKEIYLNAVNNNMSRDLWRKTEDFMVNYEEQDKLKGFED
jgi:hypothetical protein